MNLTITSAGHQHVVDVVINIDHMDPSDDARVAETIRRAMDALAHLRHVSALDLADPPDTSDPPDNVGGGPSSDTRADDVARDEFPIERHMAALPHYADPHRHHCGYDRVDPPGPECPKSRGHAGPC